MICITIDVYNMFEGQIYENKWKGAIVYFKSKIVMEDVIWVYYLYNRDTKYCKT